MKIFKVSIFLILIMPTLSSAQIGIDEYNKYWYYRHRLTTEFMVMGDERSCEEGASGYNIPAHTTYAGTKLNISDNNTMLNYTDGTTDLAYYIGVLATEHKLLKDAGWDTEQTDKELYLAMRALERLDRKSGLWFYDDDTCNGLNGYFIRDDVTKSIFDKNPVFERYKIGNKYSYRTDYERSLNKLPGEMATITADHVSHLFEGLALVKKCLGNYTYNGYEFKNKATTIAENIAFYLNDDDWFVKDEHGKSPKHSKLLRHEGTAYLLAKSAGFISNTNDPNDKDYTSDDFLSNVSSLTVSRWKWYVKNITYSSIMLNLIPRKKDYVASHIVSATAVGNPFGDEKSREILDHVEYADKYDLGYFNLLRNYLRNQTRLSNGRYDTDLIKAPCYGITRRPQNSVIVPGHRYYDGASEWIGANRWVRYSDRWHSFNEKHEKGHGLDYMILYNLYLLYYKNVDRSFVGELPERAPAYHLKISQTSNLSYDLESFNNIVINSPISFVANTRNIVANNTVFLKSGFSYKATSGRKLIISSRGPVNACGDVLDEYGEPILLNPSNSRIAADTNDDETKTEGHVFERKSNYKPLEDYLAERNSFQNIHKSSLEVELFPNPTDGNNINVLIESDVEQSAIIKVMDNTGRVIQDYEKKNLNSNLNTFNLELKNKNTGVYFVSISTKNENRVVKLIIE